MKPESSISTNKYEEIDPPYLPTKLLKKDSMNNLNIKIDISKRSATAKNNNSRPQSRCSGFWNCIGNVLCCCCNLLEVLN